MTKKVIKSQRYLPITIKNDVLLKKMHSQFLEDLSQFDEEEIKEVLQFFKLTLINLGLSLNIEV